MNLNKKECHSQYTAEGGEQLVRKNLCGNYEYKTLGNPPRKLLMLSDTFIFFNLQQWGIMEPTVLTLKTKQILQRLSVL